MAKEMTGRTTIHFRNADMASEYDGPEYGDPAKGERSEGADREESRRSCRVFRLGLVEYGRACEIQRALADDLAARRGWDSLILLEHPPTYTLGKRGKEEHLLAPRQVLHGMGIAIHRTDRGGDVTYHGPGQLVAYPVIDLGGRPGGVSRYVRDLEESVIRALAAFAITGERLQGHPGVWVGNDKIAAIGVKINARRIASHGFAVNVTTDLSYFDRIVPCGIRDRGVTSVARILGSPVPLSDVEDRVVAEFGAVFGMEMIEESGRHDG